MPGPMPDSRSQALRAPAVVELRDDPGGRHWCGRPVPAAAQPHKGRPEGRPGRASGRSGAGEQPRHLRFCRAPSRERSSLGVHGRRGHRRLGRGVLGGARTTPPAAAAPGPGQSGSSGRTGWRGGASLGRSGVVSRSGAAVATRRREGVGLRPGPARRRHIGVRPRAARPSPGPRSLQSYPLPARKPTDFLWPPPNKNP